MPARNIRNMKSRAIKQLHLYGDLLVLPITADIENGYAENNIILKENIIQLIDTGIVGINFINPV